MARGRMISKSWSTSRKRAAIYRDAGQLAEFCLQLFPLLVVHTDDYGRLDGDAETVKLLCDPGSPRAFSEFERALAFMEKAGLIRRYRAADTVWLQIEQFDANQPGLLSKRAKPTTPAPPHELSTVTELPGNSGSIEPNLTKEKKEQILAKAASHPSEPFLIFPAIGLVPEWALSETQVVEWVRLFPVIDVRGECRKALAWVLANPGRRKTAKGMARFLVNWLGRAVDSGRGTRTSPPKDAAGASHLWTCPHEPKCLERHKCHIKQQIAAHKAGAA